MTYYNGSCTTVQEFCQTFGLTWKEGETCIGKEEEDIPFNTLYRRLVIQEKFVRKSIISNKNNQRLVLS